MDDAEEQERKTRALRKRKAIYAFEENYDSDSSDFYKPPRNLEGDSSDDSIFEVKRRVKKYKKKKTSHNDAETEAKRKKTCKFPKGPEDDSSDDSITEVKKKVKKNMKRKTSLSGAKQEVRGKKSRGRGRLPLEKSTAQERKKKKKEINNRGKEKEGKSQQIEKTSSSRTPGLGPYSVIGHWYIASGFMKDLPALFEAFDEQESWRFNAFATCWRKCKFSLIYRGRHSFKELLEFTEEICFWTKKFLSPLHTMKWRVGALYVLYGLYYKHPFRHFYKIRMEIEEYENLVSLAGSFQSSAENPDPAYIFYKLKADGVFFHVASSDEMGLNFYSLERQQDIMNYEMQWVLHEHSSSAIFPERERNIQKTLMQEYEKVKSQIWGDGKGPDKAMSYVQSSILSEVDTVLAGLQEDGHQQPATHSQASADVNHSHAASAEISDIGRRKSEIRKKAAALSTTEDFFKRKQLRSPQKSYKKKVNQHSRKAFAGSVSDDANTEEDILSDDDTNKVMKLKKIMEFMQPPEDISLMSFNIKKNRTSQKHLTEEKNYSDSDGSPSDSQNILLPNESPKQRPEELKALKLEDGNTTSLQQLRPRRSSQRKSFSPQKAVQCEKTHPKNKARRMSLPKQKARRGRPRKCNLKNTAKCEPHEKSQISERNETLERKSGSENMLSKNVLIGTASVSNKQKELLSDDMEKELGEKVLESETLEKEQNRSKKTQRQRLKKFKKPRKAPSYITEEVISSAGADKENSSPALDKNQSEKACEEVCDDQVITSENICENVCKHEAITSENVCEEVFDDQTITSKNVCEDFFEVCNNDTIMTSLKKKNNVSPLLISNDMQNALNSLSQEHCNEMNHVGKVLEVEILAGIPKKKNLQSVLKAESMVYLEVHFKEDNVMVHSVKFKMSKKDLKILQNNKEKLQGLRKNFYSSLPPKYKNYELHLQLTVDQLVKEENGASEKEQCKQGSEPLPEEYPKQGCDSPQKYDKQGFEPSLENHFRQCSESSSEKHSKQGYEPTPVLPKTSGTLTKTDNTIPHEEPLTFNSQEGKGPSHMIEGNHNASSLSHGTCDDTNLVGKVLEVEMLATVPKGSNVLSVSGAKSIFYLNVNFQVEGATIYSIKFKIAKSDLDTLQNNKKKLENLKAKFRSFLPPKYQKYEMQLQLTVLQSGTDGNETPQKHSRQSSDSSTALAQDSATQVKANTGTPHMKPSTSHSQKSLSKKCTTNEVCTSMSPSKSPAPLVPQKAANSGEVKGYYSSKSVDQDQDYISTATQSTHTRLDSLPESPVGFFVSEGRHHPESCNTLKSNGEDNAYIHLSSTPNKLSELLQMQNQAIIYINEDSFSCQDYCSSQNTVNVVDASMEENYTVKTGNQILLYKEEIVPTTHVESKLVNTSECKPDDIHVDGTITGTQVCETAPQECPPKSPDAERSLPTVHADNSLEKPCYDFMNNILSTSSPARKSKDIHASPDKCIKPNYVKEEISHSTESFNKSTHELDTENCTILWKTRSNPTTMNDKNLLTSLPFNNSSCGHFKIMREGQGKATSTTVRMTGDMSLSADPGMSLSADPGKSLASTSTVNKTVAKDVNVLSPLAHYPSKNLSGNLLESPRTGISISKTNSNSVCSFYFFSKRNKCDLSKRKQTRPSDSSVKKPCVPFLFMEKLLSKKDQ